MTVARSSITLVASRPLGPGWPAIRKWRVEGEEGIEGVELQDSHRADRYALAHRATSGHVTWQVTWFDELGPVGDSRRASLEVALNDLAAPGEYYVKAIHTKEDRVTRNPAAPRAAIDKYREFHRKDPMRVAPFAASFALPEWVVCVGDARNVLYRSDKVDPETLRQPERPINYIHDHDPGVAVYEPCAEGDEHAERVPGWIADVDALVLLGTNLGFAFTARGSDELVEARVRAPRPELYATPDGRALVVVQSKRFVLALMWGGALGVESRGIVG